MDIRKLDDSVAVAPQIDPADMGAARAAGYAKIVNNRPDGEDAGQPAAADIEAGATAAGLAYEFIPLGREGVTPEHIDRVREALESAEGPVLMFCRSGTRSATLWALAEASRGRGSKELIERAARAGYDLSGYRGVLDSLAP